MSISGRVHGGGKAGRRGDFAWNGVATREVEFPNRLLVLLCHKFFRSKICWQHGQRGSVREIAQAMAMRTEVIEFGT